MRGWWLGVSLLAACGPVRGGEDLGPPIHTFYADLQGDAIPEVEGELRVVFGWMSYGDGPWVQCFERTGRLLECGFPAASDYETKLVLFNVAAQPRLPGGLGIPFYDFPELDDLIVHNDSVFAFGGLALYDDRNGNGELDPIEPNDANPDIVLAESVITEVSTLAIFHEGAEEHAIKEGIFDRALDCPEAPQGYSVGKYTREGGCEIGRNTPLLMTRSDPAQLGRARCGGAIAGLTFEGGAKEPPPTLPPNAVVECGVNNAIVVWLDNGGYCDRYRQTRYTLQSPPATPPADRWDLIDDPPEYWQCRIVRGGG